MAITFVLIGIALFYEARYESVTLDKQFDAFVLERRRFFTVFEHPRLTSMNLSEVSKVQAVLKGYTGEGQFHVLVSFYNGV